MRFEPAAIYHIYNQGNNQQQIFFKDDNYLFFIWKMRKLIFPHVHFLSYCLMPNHFHWLVVTKPSACELSNAVKPKGKWSDDFESSDHLQQNLSHSIAILLSSYTRAINKQENRKGSLFRQKTKAKNGWIKDVLTVDDKLFFRSDNDYARQCFQYIHENPVRAELVQQAEAWQFSSARDYAGLRNGSLCNKKLAEELLWQIAAHK